MSSARCNCGAPTRDSGALFLSRPASDLKHATVRVEFTGSIDTFFTTLKDAPSSSSSFIVHTDRLDDKDETDESIR